LRNINLEIEAVGKTSHMKETTTKKSKHPHILQTSSRFLAVVNPVQGLWNSSVEGKLWILKNVMCLAPRKVGTPRSGKTDHRC